MKIRYLLLVVMCVLMSGSVFAIDPLSINTKRIDVSRNDRSKLIREYQMQHADEPEFDGCPSESFRVINYFINWEEQKIVSFNQWKMTIDIQGSSPLQWHQIGSNSADEAAYLLSILRECEIVCYDPEYKWLYSGWHKTGQSQ